MSGYGVRWACGAVGCGKEVGNLFYVVKEKPRVPRFEAP